MDGIAERYSLFRLISQAVSQAGEGEEYTKEGARADKGKKIPIIPSPNAIIDPYAMMILRFYAAVAYSTMMTSWRSPNITCLTILCGNVHSAIGRPCRLYCSPLCGRWPQREWIVRVLRGREWMEVSRQYLAAVRESVLIDPFNAYPRVCHRCMYKGRHAYEEKICKKKGYRR